MNVEKYAFKNGLGQGGSSLAELQTCNFGKFKTGQNRFMLSKTSWNDVDFNISVKEGHLLHRVFRSPTPGQAYWGKSFERNVDY